MLALIGLIKTCIGLWEESQYEAPVWLNSSAEMLCIESSLCNLRLAWSDKPIELTGLMQLN